MGGWRVHCVVRAGWVGGPFCTWESFCVLWEMNPFFCFYNTGLPLVLGSTVPPSPVLHSSVLYYRTYYCCRVINFALQSLYIYRGLYLYYRTYGGTAVLPCYYFVLLALNTEDTAPICSCPPYRPATGIFRE